MRKRIFRSKSRWHKLYNGWPIFLALLLCVGLVVNYRMRPPQQVTLNKTAPHFTLPSLTGQNVALQEFRGRVVFLNFWASWCRYCAEEAAGLQTFAERYPTKAQIIGVNDREEEAAISLFQQLYDISFPLLRDEQGRVGDMYLLKALPQTWVIDESGIARREWVGPVSFEDLQMLYQQITGASIDEARPIGPVKERYQLVTHEGLYLMDAEQAWYSDDAGVTWTVMSRSITPGLQGEVSALSWSTQEGLAWVVGAGLYRAKGAATMWELVRQSDLPTTMHVTLAAAPTGKRYWAGTNQGLFTSADVGETWKKLPINRSINGVALQLDGQELLMATDQGLWRCTLEGAQESLVPNSPIRRFDAVAVLNIGDKERILVIAPNGDLYHTDGAGNWQLIND
jgi:peroxiredoxin